MKLKELVKTFEIEFRKKHQEPLAEAEILIAAILRQDRAWLYSQSGSELEEEDLRRLTAALQRRLSGEPLAYISGYKDFYKHRFFVGPGVLTPRPETEALVEFAVAYFKKSGASGGRLADFGCGSGCVGLSVLADCPGIRVCAIDSSLLALEYTRKNLAILRPDLIGNDGQFSLIHSRVEEFDFEEKFDVIVANPPYIAPGDRGVSEDVKRFEPQRALFAEREGLEFIESWAQKARTLLLPQGRVFMEIGSIQADRAKRIFVDLGFDFVETSKDLGGLDRVVTAGVSSKGDIWTK